VGGLKVGSPTINGQKLQIYIFFVDHTWEGVDKLFKLPKLQTLQIVTSQQTRKISLLTNLTDLSIRSCLMEISLGMALRKMTNLVNLNISGNNMQYLGDLKPLINLRNLVINFAAGSPGHSSRTYFPRIISGYSIVRPSPKPVHKPHVPSPLPLVYHRGCSFFKPPFFFLSLSHFLVRLRV
jgi:hypothetical protein